jgi:uncharacterized lipoprotein YbaY
MAERATVTGAVLYLQRIALGPTAAVTVRLVDVSLADASAEVLAEQTIAMAGRQVPIPFELAYAPDAIDERHDYAVQARIEEEGALRFLTTRRYAVITHGHPTDGLEIRVDPPS